MNSIEIINNSLNYSALVVIIILMIAALLGCDLKQKVFRWFFYLVLFSLLCILSDAAIVLMLGTPGAMITILCKIFDFICYALNGLMVFAFSMYLYEYLKLKVSISHMIYRLMVFCGAASVLLAVIAQFTGMYSRFDESNNYIQQPLFWVSLVFPIITFLICMALTLFYIKALKAREWISLLLYPVAPIVCFVMETAYHDIWVSNVGSTLTTLLIYITLQVELRNRIIKQDAELQEARIAIMLSQIHPHFLYNALGAIQDLCKHDAAQAEVAVRDFSKYLRRNIDSIYRKEPIDFSQELEHVNTYLALEKKRFVDRLNIVYDIQSEKFSLPALTLQTLVENAVTHGATEREDGGTVTIRTREESDGWYITVEDDGMGFPDILQKEEERSHIGIENTRRRLELFGGALKIQSIPNIGTTAIITIPKERGISL